MNVDSGQWTVIQDRDMVVSQGAINWAHAMEPPPLGTHTLQSGQWTSIKLITIVSFKTYVTFKLNIWLYINVLYI